MVSLPSTLYEVERLFLRMKKYTAAAKTAAIMITLSTIPTIANALRPLLDTT